MEYIKIPKDLFLQIAVYFIAGLTDDEESIRDALEKKVDAMVKHDYYTAYKTAESPEEREKARLKYLESSDIAQDFRW